MNLRPRFPVPPGSPGRLIEGPAALARPLVPVANRSTRPVGGRVRLIVLVALLLFQVAVPLDPSTGERIRTLLLGCTACFLVCTWLYTATSFRAALRVALIQPGCPAAALFLFWIILSALRSGLPTLAAYEAYRHGAGVLLLIGIACGLCPASSRRGAYAALLALAAALAALVATNAGSRPRIGGAFIDEQLLAAALCLLLPFAVALALSDPQPGWRRLAGLVVTAALGGITFTQNRSAWFGLLPTGLMLIWAATNRVCRASSISPYRLAAMWMAGSILALVLIAGREPAAAAWRRVRTLPAYGGDATYLWRAEQWQVARRLIAEQPLLGWGVGTYATQLARFDNRARSPREILLQGSSLSENVHNSYLQLGAEIGLPGLALFLAIPLSIAARLIRMVRARCGALLQILRVASLAALAAQAITALANPAWEFSQCSTLQWYVFGLASLLARKGSSGEGLSELPAVVVTR